MPVGKRLGNSASHGADDLKFLCPKNPESERDLQRGSWLAGCTSTPCRNYRHPQSERGDLLWQNGPPFLQPDPIPQGEVEKLLKLSDVSAQHISQRRMNMMGTKLCSAMGKPKGQCDAGCRKRLFAGNTKIYRARAKVPSLLWVATILLHSADL